MNDSTNHNNFIKLHDNNHDMKTLIYIWSDLTTKIKRLFMIGKGSHLGTLSCIYWNILKNYVWTEELEDGSLTGNQFYFTRENIIS